MGQVFEPLRPNDVWTGDITYISTDEAWLYLAALKDVFSCKIVGYAGRVDDGGAGQQGTVSAVLLPEPDEPMMLMTSPFSAVSDSVVPHLGHDYVFATQLLPARMIVEQARSAWAEYTNDVEAASSKADCTAGCNSLNLMALRHHPGLERKLHRLLI